MLLHAFDTESRRYDTNAEMPQSFSPKKKISDFKDNWITKIWKSIEKKLEEPRSKIAWANRRSHGGTSARTGRSVRSRFVSIGAFELTKKLKFWEFWKTKIEEDALRVTVPWNGIRVLRWGIERYQVLVHGNELRAIFRFRNFGKEQKQSEESNHSFFSRQLFL